MISNVKDKAGRELKKGDIVVYGHLLGRCAGLQYGKITNIRLVDGTVWNPKTRTHDDTSLGRFTVQGVDIGWNGGLELLRKGTLLYSDRILIVSRDQVPADVLALLDTVEIQVEP